MTQIIEMGVDDCMYYLAASEEFKWLCRAIVHDGRDPDLVAMAMTEKLQRRVREMQVLVKASQPTAALRDGQEYTRRPNNDTEQQKETK